jgi:hypothetical protein
MKAPSSTRLSIAAIATAALLAAPTAASAEEAVVPPSNSAATQYTETFPTSGGDKKTDRKPKHRSPSKVLGSHNAQKLEKQGPEGKAVAEIAAETAPPSVAAQSAAKAPSPQSSGGGNDGGDKNSKGGGNSEANAPQRHSDTSGKPQVAQPPATEPAGTSGVGSALGQATGLSSASASGPLLPLLIVATVVWALAYFWRQRRRVD